MNNIAGNFFDWNAKRAAVRRREKWESVCSSANDKIKLVGFSATAIELF